MDIEEKIKKSLNKIKISLKDHGGDIKLIKISKDYKIYVKLLGACRGCIGAIMTMKQKVEKVLKKDVPEIKEVILVDD